MRNPTLTLVIERKLTDLLDPPTKNGVLEASGVVARGWHYYVIFDNIRRVGRIHRSLATGARSHTWFGDKRDGEGYEDIAFSTHTRRFYLLIEAEKHPDGTFKALIDECDERARFKGRRWVDVSFEQRNTGFEGLVAVRRRGRNFLLALCEGNRCRAGKPGRKPGGGRIHVLQRNGRGWTSIARIDLPKRAAFEDYSGIALRGRRIAVVSQRTSQLWIGTLRFADWSIAGKGRIYDFPRTRKGKPKYCTIEGVSWLSDRTFVTVSDLSKSDYAGRCQKRDQSIHVFRLPGRKARQ
jgi:hypothetical protein